MAKYYEEFETKGQLFIIRNAEGADARREIDFAEQGSRETDFCTREPGEYSKSFLPVEEAAKGLEELAKSNEELYLLAVTPEGEIAATCMCSYSSSKARARHLGDISIGVAKKYWRMGLGRRLFEVQMEWAKHSGVEVLTLLVDTLNIRALRLYLSLGFTVEGVLRKRLKMADGTYRDMYSMSKFL